MKVYTIPKYRTAFTVVEVEGKEKVVANSLPVVLLLMGRSKVIFEEAQNDLHRVHPELFWDIDEPIKQDGETPEDFVGHTSRELIGKLAERLV